MSTLELEHIKHADLASGNNISLTSAGNVGIGVTPETWHSNATSLQVGDLGALWVYDDNSNPEQLILSENVYSGVSATQKYIQTDYASSHMQRHGAHTFYVAPSGTADAAITWTTGFEVLNDGKARAKNGLLFGTDTAATNTLDDYEEGTWTGTLTNVAGSVSNTSYTKIGRLVYVTGHLVCTATATGDVQINGLPYAQKPSSNGIGTCMNYLVNVAGGSTYNFSTYLTGSGLRFYRSEDNSAWLWAGASSLYSGAQILFNLTYQTT